MRWLSTVTASATRCTFLATPLGMDRMCRCVPRRSRCLLAPLIAQVSLTVHRFLAASWMAAKKRAQTVHLPGIAGGVCLVCLARCRRHDLASLVSEGLCEARGAQVECGWRREASGGSRPRRPGQKLSVQIARRSQMLSLTTRGECVVKHERLA